MKNCLERRRRRSLKVLVVEDNAVNQKLTQVLLKKLRHRTVIAANGRAAISALKKQAFDLVLMDIQMPVMGGLEAASAIRAEEMRIGGHIPIVAMTAHAMSGDRDRAIQAGMDDYISKPIRFEDLRRAIQRHAPAGLDVAALLEGVSGDRKLLRELVDLFLADVSEAARSSQPGHCARRCGSLETSGPRFKRIDRKLRFGERI